MKKIFIVLIIANMAFISYTLSIKFGDGKDPNIYILDYDKLMISTNAYQELNNSYIGEFNKIKKEIETKRKDKDYDSQFYQRKIDELNKISNEKLLKVKDIIDKEAEIFIRTSEYKSGIIVLKRNVYYYDKTIDITDKVIVFLKDKEI
ncbi:MAG: hypothetical protein M0R03_03755 [Novosphingobium sp.]|nr:hypothetical protein [Novosphingobium sp.]